MRSQPWKQHKSIAAIVPMHCSVALSYEGWLAAATRINLHDWQEDHSSQAPAIVIKVAIIAPGKAVSLGECVLSRLLLANPSCSHSAESVQGDNFCSELMCVTAFVNSSTVTYQMTALTQLGWMAIGFGTQMADAKMVIMWSNSDGSVTLSQRTAPALVEPVPDPNPQRTATSYDPFINLSSVVPRLAFTIPRDDTIEQNAIWALGVSNPLSASPDSNLELHLDSGNFTLNLTNTIDTEQNPFLDPSPSTASGSLSSIATFSLFPSGDPSTDDGTPFQTFEKLIVAHALLSVLGFLVVLPIGSLIARWTRNLWVNWFYYHWMTQVVFGIPVVVTGWALGPLSVAAQGVAHANDSHKVLGILLLPLYLIQLSTGTFIHLRKSVYPWRHPPRNVAHGVMGMVIIGLAFYQVRTGLTVDWTIATERSIDLNVFSNLWIAWVVFIPVIYFIGFALLRRQLARERELPPAYFTGASDTENGIEFGVRQLNRGVVDDGTHDIFSEDNSQRRSGRGRRVTNDAASGDTEMREVQSEHRTPLSLPTSLSALTAST
ncbi:hypothetical protein ACEPAH_4784 [Sanghuangporus vaninii]